MMNFFKKKLRCPYKVGDAVEMGEGVLDPVPGFESRSLAGWQGTVAAIGSTGLTVELEWSEATLLRMDERRLLEMHAARMDYRKTELEWELPMARIDRLDEAPRDPEALEAFEARVSRVRASEPKPFDPSKPRRWHSGRDCGLSYCPDCGAKLWREYCVTCLSVKGDDDLCVTSHPVGYFCPSCPAVVYDTDSLESTVESFSKGAETAYEMVGIFDPEGEGDLPLTPFCNSPGGRAPKEKPAAGRNAPCPCGSGKKYKKCCG